MTATPRRGSGMDAVGSGQEKGLRVSTENRVVAVTGGGAGIGAAVARRVGAGT